MEDTIHDYESLIDSLEALDSYLTSMVVDKSASKSGVVELVKTVVRLCDQLCQSN